MALSIERTDATSVTLQVGQSTTRYYMCVLKNGDISIELEYDKVSPIECILLDDIEDFKTFVKGCQLLIQKVESGQ